MPFLFLFSSFFCISLRRYNAFRLQSYEFLRISTTIYKKNNPYLHFFINKITHFNISRGPKGRLKRNFRKQIGKEGVFT